MLTASGVRFRFFTGCQSAARSGHSVATSLNPLRTFLPEQYGQRAPSRLLTLLTIGARHS